eukprot:symbB.v1.2.002362.t1/scaffold110.1/size325157/9
MVCWRGIYMNGGESQRMDTFQQWVTFQMFGTSHRAGSEIKQCVWAYRKQQWLCLLMEKFRVPFPLLLPKPVFIIVDQFEELLKRHPDQAMAWADAICHQHGRNNYARILFVVNSDYGTQSLLNLATHGLQFERIQMHIPTEKWRFATVDRKLLQKCQQNVGLYWMVKQRLRTGSLMQSDIEGYATEMRQRWARDFTVPFPVWPHPSWFKLELTEAKKELMKGLFALLHVATAILAVVRPEIELLDSTQLFDTTMAEWVRIFSNEGSMKVLLTQQEARVVAKHLRRLMGNPVGTFQRTKAELVWIPETGLQPKKSVDQWKKRIGVSNLRQSVPKPLALPITMGMKYVAAYLMAALAGKESPSADDIKTILESVESEYDESIASKLVSELEGKVVHEVVAAGKEKLKGFGGGGGGVAVGGGGGGGAAAPAEAKKEEKKVEEEEEEEEMDFDLFG